MHKNASQRTEERTFLGNYIDYILQYFLNTIYITFYDKIFQVHANTHKLVVDINYINFAE